MFIPYLISTATVLVGFAILFGDGLYAFTHWKESSYRYGVDQYGNTKEFYRPRVRKGLIGMLTAPLWPLYIPAIILYLLYRVFSTGVKVSVGKDI